MKKALTITVLVMSYASICLSDDLLKSNIKITDIFKKHTVKNIKLEELTEKVKVVNRYEKKSRFSNFNKKFRRDIKQNLNILLGTDSSGGGNSIVFKDGRVELIDLVNPSFLQESDIATKKERIDLFWKKNRYVKSIATFENLFFDRAKNIFEMNHNEFPVLKKLNKKLAGLHATLVEFRADPKKRYLSGSFQADIQEPLAVYINHELLVSKRPYRSMNKLHQTGLSIHEAMRHLNFLDLLEEELTTADIEVLVRFFLGQSFDDDDISSAKKKLLIVRKSKEKENILVLREARKNKMEIIERIYEIVEIETQSEEFKRAYSELEILQNEMDNADDLRFKNFYKKEYHARYQQAHRRYFEYLSKMPEKNKLTNKQLIELNLLENDRMYWDNIEHDCVYRDLVGKVEDLEKSTMGLSAVISNVLLQIEFSYCQKFDVLKLEIVQRCF